MMEEQICPGCNRVVPRWGWRTAIRDAHGRLWHESCAIAGLALVEGPVDGVSVLREAGEKERGRAEAFREGLCALSPLGLSVRAHNALMRALAPWGTDWLGKQEMAVASLLTFEEWVDQVLDGRFPAAELLTIRNFGEKSLEGLMEALRYWKAESRPVTAEEKQIGVFPSPPTRYPEGICPSCGSGDVVYTGSQVCGMEEAWEDGEVVAYDTRDWDGWIGPIRGRCRGCGHEWKE